MWFIYTVEYYLTIKNEDISQVVVVHAFNLGIWEAEAGGFLSSMHSYEGRQDAFIYLAR